MDKRMKMKNKEKTLPIDYRTEYGTIRLNMLSSIDSSTKFEVTFVPSTPMVLTQATLFRNQPKELMKLVFETAKEKIISHIQNMKFQDWDHKKWVKE